MFSMTSCYNAFGCHSVLLLISKIFAIRQASVTHVKPLRYPHFVLILDRRYYKIQYPISQNAYGEKENLSVKYGL